MPPKKATPADVAKVKVEPEEQQQLESDMKDKAARARHTMAFRYWLDTKASAQEKQDWDSSTLNVKGKQEMLLRWLVYRARNFAVECAEGTTVSLTTSRKSALGYRWMSAEQMDKEYGTNKGQHWRNSQKLETRADRVTGSTDPNLLEFKVPQPPKYAP